MTRRRFLLWGAVGGVETPPLAIPEGVNCAGESLGSLTREDVVSLGSPTEGKGAESLRSPTEGRAESLRSPTEGEVVSLRSRTEGEAESLRSPAWEEVEHLRSPTREEVPMQAKLVVEFGVPTREGADGQKYRHL